MSATESGESVVATTVTKWTAEQAQAAAEAFNIPIYAVTAEHMEAIGLEPDQTVHIDHVGGLVTTTDADGQVRAVPLEDWNRNPT